MIKHLWTMLCKLSVTDADTNNVSLINVIEHIGVAGRPAGAEPGEPVLARLPLEIMIMWERGDYDVPTSGKAQVQIIDPTGRKLGGGEMAVDLSLGRRCRSKMNLPGFLVTVSGRYVMRITLREDGAKRSTVVSEYPVDVDIDADVKDSAE